MPEVGRDIVKEQLSTNGKNTPWENPQGFCENLIEKSLIAYRRAAKLAEQNNGMIFFDRSFLEGISYFQKLNNHKYDHLVSEFRYFKTVFIVPPWQEIFCQDDERKLSFLDALEEYNRLLKFYAQSGYSIVQIPKVSVARRSQFIISYLDKI